MDLLIQAFHLIFLKDEGEDSIRLRDSFASLCTNEQHWTNEEKTSFSQVAGALKPFFSDEMLEKFRFDDMIKTFFRLGSNAFTISDEEIRPVGSGIFLLGSMLNHSCCPNSVQVFEGKTLVVKAVERIDVGEEIEISYVELADPTSRRRAKLFSDYYIQCDCHRCLCIPPIRGYSDVEGLKKMDALESNIVALDGQSSEIGRLKNEGKFDVALALCLEGIEHWKRFLVFFWSPKV